MRAAWYVTQGPPREVLQVGRQPQPYPGPGEVRVRIHASGVNPSDIYARGGMRGIPMADDLVIPHQDGAGVVDEIGPGVSRTWLRRRVWVHMVRWQRPFGTAAEWVVVPLDRVALLPDSYSFALGACLGIPWLTADLAVATLGAIAGRDVLVLGGAGAVAIYAIQIAAAQGARVVATVGSRRGADLAADAGASETLDYRRDDVGARLRRASRERGFDRVVEPQMSANAPLYRAFLGKRARVVIYGTSDQTISLDISPAIRNQVQLRFVYAFAMTPRARRRAVERLASMEATRPITHLPIELSPLEAIAEAHDAVESGNRGRRSVIDLSGAA